VRRAHGYTPTATAPPPPPPPAGGSTAATGARGAARVKLVLADGTESTLPEDPELSARADYLVNGILKPPPPA